MSDISNSPLAPLERLELMLPGFKGYKRKDLIRQDDFLVRNAIKLRLSNAMRELESKQSELAMEDPFNPLVHKYEDLLSRLRSLTTEVEAAPGGMYTYYDRFKMFEDDMKKLVQFDYQLIASADKVLEMVRGNADLGQIREIVDSMKQTFSDRQKLFMPEKVR
ncbi:hypothetical protein HS1genome_2109 [Sulfodiicoccus acidiphilus]|uniref:Uncharacterized protein n=1 Tax=Sulfodiicoccus acidiphilus TaxID=1670455 RepID=A0A348B6B8_9CREN|nr:hypothetical protein [Sulfodiicoccus acidiphilus]BBD73720.1 hypothetical protein HS1genome_2109 [Sulfodiicoccus acidiphilus]GGT97862.1 hypothetical protein GCM10007116_14260 [Sulfodiicoccus acidiphilus]